MALPSQADRSSEMGRSGATAGSKKGFDPVIVALVVLVVAALAFGAIAIIRGKSTEKLPENEITRANIPANTNTITPDKTPVAVNTTTGTAATTTPGSTPTTSPTGNPSALVAKPDPKQPDPTVINQGGTNPSNPKVALQNDPNQPGNQTGGKPAPIDVTGNNVVATNPATTPGAQPIVPTASTSDVLSLIDAGERESQKGNLLAARVIFSKALLDPRTTAPDHAILREKLTRINDDLFFGTKITSGDQTIEEYKIVAGDRVANLPKKLQLPITWELIGHVNKLSDAGAVRIGQTLRIPRGPFHAIVTKSEYRADIFTGSPDEPDQWIFVRSFKVGLGENDGTPVGTFTVRNKMKNPSWVNPRGGQRFAADDPKNPIGERWVGLEGVGPSANIKGYGIHGTIEPDSIGQSRSMGCVRLGDEDVKWVYEMLVEKISVVQIKP